MPEETTHRKNKLVEQAKATTPAKIDVKLRILNVVIILDRSKGLAEKQTVPKKLFRVLKNN